MQKLIALGLLLLGLQLSSCQRNDPSPALAGEVEATIVSYSSPLEKYLTTCAESWQVDIAGQPYRSRAVPAAFQQDGLAVWIKY